MKGYKRGVQTDMGVNISHRQPDLQQSYKTADPLIFSPRCVIENYENKKDRGKLPLSNCLPCRIQHIFYENTVTTGGGVDEDMSYGTNQFAVLDDGTAAHE